MANPQIVLIGLYHFDNPNLDQFNMETDDVLSPKRQAEVQAVVDKLATFRPTKIAIEYPAERRERLDELYQEYVRNSNEGIASEKRNEIYQLAFRLGHQMGHERLYPIDVRQDLDFEGMMSYAEANGQGDVVQNLMTAGQEVVKQFSERQATSTVSELLRWFNQADMLASNHNTYMDILKVGDAPDYIGVKLVADWYARNFKVFNELTKIADEGSRIIAFYGQGHIPILRQLVEDCTYLDLVDPLDYLYTKPI